MTGSERFRRADQLFDEALDLPRAERAAFLDRACQGDAELRALVGRLLANAEADHTELDPGGALVAPLLERLRSEMDRDTDRPEEDPLLGATVGRYRVVREIGRGGMAVVYLAERADGQFRQQVALKVLQGSLAVGEIGRRFDQERQILALARHPGIARLLDGGVAPGGQPYLVMEHVEGRPIDRYCDDEALSVADRVRLFLQVARAVEDAHRNLVVHRDIKPSNILVTPEGHAKLLDFGIAKLLDPNAAAPFSRSSVRLMTPAYASPEQVQGNPVTTASDVYQLGLLLYLLLAGCFPYDVIGGDPGERLRVIAHQEPARPSAAVAGEASCGAAPGHDRRAEEEVARLRSTTPARLRRALAGDLDSIVLTALRKEPEKRYSSVGQMIADLERHLAGRTVTTRPDTWAYRTGRLLRRHRAGFAASAIVLAVVATLAGIHTAQLTRERDRAHLAAERSVRAAEFLRGLFAVAAPERARGGLITARQVLDHGAARIENELAGQPGLQADLMVQVGDAYRAMALRDEAKSLLLRAVEIRRRRPGEGSLDLAAALDALARVLADRNEREASLAAFGEALALREKALGADHPDVARTRDGLGQALAHQGRFAEARREHERALAILLPVYGAAHPEVALVQRNLGIALRGEETGKEETGKR